MATRKSDEVYSEQETQQRFEKLVHLALNTPPKPMHEMKRRKRAKRGAGLKKKKGLG